MIQADEGIGEHLKSGEGETGCSGHDGDRYGALGEGHDGCAESQYAHAAQEQHLGAHALHQMLH